MALATITAVAAPACGSGASGGSGDKGYGTVTSGVVTVATEAFAPYVTLDGANSLGGLEGQLFTSCVKKLGQRLRVVRVSFDASLAGVQANRYDVAMGSLAWTDQRAKAGRMTDPLYYNPRVIIRPQRTPPVTTIDQLQGKTVGTGKGYTVIPAIQDIPGTKLRTYDTVDTMFQDISVGRTDLGTADPLVETYAAQKRPDLKLATSYLQPPTAAQLSEHPDYKYFLRNQAVWYLPRKESMLESAFNGCIADDFKSGATINALKQYGADPQQFLCPTEKVVEERHGVDRPKGWQPPHASGCAG